MKKLYSLVAVCSIAAASYAQSTTLVINEAYGGGGNSGATYKQDFIEIKNIGSTPISLDGKYLHYASAANAFSSYHALPNVTLQPGQLFVVRESQGNGGTVDVPADYIAPIPTGYNGNPSGSSAGFAMGGSSFKIALTSSTNQPTAAVGGDVIDFVAAGSNVNMYEGTGGAPAPSNTASVQRKNTIVDIDTDDNSVDFIVAAPTPGESYLAISDLTATKKVLVKNTNIQDEVTFGAKSNDVKVFNMLGQVVKTASVKENETLNVSDLKAGSYIVTGTVANEAVSQKVIKN